MFILLVATLAILLFYILVMKRQKTWIKRNVKQLCTTPLFGDTLMVLLRQDTIALMIKKIYNSYPNERYVGGHILTCPTLVLRDTELIKELLVKNFDYFSDHVNFSNDTDKLWSKNVFSLSGDEWRHMRIKLTPAFTGSKLRTMFKFINDNAKRTTTYYLNKNEQQIDLELKDTFTRYANDIIATCLFGITTDSFKEPKNEFYIRSKRVMDFTNLIRNCKIILGFCSPLIGKLLNAKLFDNDISNAFQKIISDSVRMRESQQVLNQDIITLLMGARKGISPEEMAVNIDKVMKLHSQEITDADIAAQGLLLLIASYFTISAVSSFFAYELVANPDIQERLIEEVDETLEACNGEITYDSLTKMKYMDMIFSEVLRKWPPTNVCHRVCTKPFTIQPKNHGEKPIPIRVGELLWIPIVGLHYDPKYFENPDIFDPERFSDENKPKIKPYAYLPFGAGPRICIGPRFAAMGIKTIIFNILSKYRFLATKKSVIPFKVDKKNLSLSSEAGFWMAIKRR